MTLPQQSALYNQYRLSDDDFVANFIARQDVLDLLCRRLLSVGSASDAPHQIIIGPRGMGKTSLLRRISIVIDRDPILSALYVPLSFREEQYNVLSLADFWRNCGESLAEWAEAQGKADLAERLDDELISNRWTTDHDAADRFFAEMNALKKRAVLLVDNVDLIIDALADADRWTLRRHLQMRNGPIMVGAATQPLRESAERAAAFYEFFQPHYLDPLEATETEACMRALAKRRGDFGAHVLQVLETQPARLKTLHTLTGGNPRVLALIYRLLEAAESDATMADLDILLDQVTPYYKSRIEEYATPLQRATIDAIALNWDPITTSDLSQITNVPSTTLSPLLIKLRKDGLIELVQTSGAYSGHQVVERFLNIWYLMRHGTRRAKQKMRWLVAFLTSFYSPRDLLEIDRHAKSCGEAKRWHRDFAFAFEQALHFQKYANKKDFTRASKIADLFALSQEATDGIASVTTGSGHRIDNAADLLREGDAAADAEQYRHAIEVFETLIARFDGATEPELRVHVAQAMLNKGLALDQIGDHAAEVVIYDALIARFDGVTEPELRVHVAQAMLNKGITLGEIGERAAEIDIYDALIARFDQATAPAIQEPVARAMLNKGAALGAIGDRAAEIDIYDVLVARFDQATALAIQVHVARAMLDKGSALGEIGDRAAEIDIYDALIARFDQATAFELRAEVAEAMIFKGFALGEIGEHTAEICVYDDIVARFDKSPEPELQAEVADALIFKGLKLGEIGERAAEIDIYDALIARFDQATAPVIQVQVSRAMLHKGSALGTIGERAAEIDIYDALIARFDQATAPAIQVQVARAMFEKGSALGVIGELAAEIDTYDALVARFDQATAPELQEQIAWAMFNRGVSLCQIGQHAAAISCLDAALIFVRNAEFEEKVDMTGRISIGLASYLFDLRGEITRPEQLLLQAVASNPPLAYVNLLWVYVSSSKLSEATSIRRQLDDLPLVGQMLVDAALALASEDFGLAMTQLETALSGEMHHEDWDFVDDLERLMRLAEVKGYGGRLIEWFEKTGFADRLAPIHAAFKAYVCGEKMLLDVNPEVRQAAKVIFDRLSAARHYQSGKLETEEKSSSRKRIRKMK